MCFENIYRLLRQRGVHMYILTLPFWLFQCIGICVYISLGVWYELFFIVNLL